MANEKVFRTWLKDKLSEFAFVTKIESFTVSGIPDLHTIHNGKDVWIETKSIDGLAIKMRVAQWGWMRSFVAEQRGNHVLAIQRPKVGEKRPRTVIDMYRGTTLLSASKQIVGADMSWDNTLKPDFSFTQPASKEVIEELVRFLYGA